MSDLLCSGWFPYLMAFLIGLATAWWIWSGRKAAAPVIEREAAPQPVVTAPEPVAVEVEAPSVIPEVAAVAAVAAAPLVAAAVAKPKAKAAPKTKAEPKAAPAPVKAKAAPKVTAPKVTAPKAKVAAVAAPLVAAAAVVKAVPKAAPKAKVAEAPKPKVAVAKPVAVKATPAPKPKAEPKPKAVAKPKPAPKPVIPDNLELLKGIGPKLNGLLKSLGVTSFEQVANWTATDIADIDAKLGAFAGRIQRDNWVDQAKLLSKGDVAGFEKKYGSLGSEIKKG